MKIILASSSPRRLNLLTQAGFHFEVIHPDVDETCHDGELPEDYVQRLALAKAETVEKENSLVIGADTVVVLDGKFLNKPVSKLEARAILESLSGKTHSVYTGLCLICSKCGLQKTAYENTIVHFNNLTETAILKYIESGEPLDKAGAYGIQGMGSFLVRKIEGELDTVIGFPMKLFRKMIEVHRECLNRL